MAPSCFAPPPEMPWESIVLGPIGDSPTEESNVPTGLLDADAPEKPKVLRVLSRLFERLVERNEMLKDSDRLPQDSRLTVFHGLRAPSIGVEAYIDRIFKYANCSTVCFIVAYVYIDRLLQAHPELPINSLNVHRLLITTIMAAAKFLDDAYYNNAYYAKVGGVTTTEVNRLELQLLFLLDFRLYVSPESLTQYHEYLEAMHDGMVAESLHMPVPVPAAAAAPAKKQAAVVMDVDAHVPAAGYSVASAAAAVRTEYVYTPGGVVPLVAGSKMSGCATGCGRCGACILAFQAGGGFGYKEASPRDHFSTVSSGAATPTRA
mmetsp:Transcript_45022/g.143379  ORF Transcript_45022/g.143379 Transcript_45022/m.143379 type:complete len:319 (+) Transcript_45022:167-1123(+)|eukprot:CAMPEP_0182900754 /NCGR_PEP_ID=MMETSP0034_2-20130328/29087_1 /TAXON_ID=156128 /ORGANISM="Nephroselmis pyriformis, Strain CCMP717" /LENGTH=318 /DNA_ID=CAMNT_0025035023 /DNA_START=119 /DNA_END=1075 /DNA_ORIENTATION=-